MRFGNQDEERANEFLINFRELIEQAGDLIWTSDIANIVGGGRKQALSLKKAIVSFIETPQKKQPIVPIITTVKMGTKRMVHLMSGLTNIQKYK